MSISGAPEAVAIFYMSAENRVMALCSVDAGDGEAMARLWW